MNFVVQFHMSLTINLIKGEQVKRILFKAVTRTVLYRIECDNGNGFQGIFVTLQRDPNHFGDGIMEVNEIAILDGYPKEDGSLDLGKLRKMLIDIES